MGLSLFTTFGRFLQREMQEDVVIVACVGQKTPLMILPITIVEIGPEKKVHEA